MNNQVILELKNVSVYANRHTSEEIQILKNINLKVYQNDFITLLGSNGAGKSTLFNVIAGNLAVDEGQILLAGKDITHLSEEKRTRYISRVFQDPKLGTAPRMTVAENLLLATKRGQRRGLRPRRLNQHNAEFKQITASMPNQLSNRLKTPTGSLSGGQRQALSFLMATIKRPEILLLDEHTAALDPKTSTELMVATQERITADHLTALMITHQLSDAVKYGNRLLVLRNGQITQDLNAEEKAQADLRELSIY
ncbi:ATP-binding cassette domain-containing protein [Pediococcus acidilactici]|uniref:ABC transporter ATP-binding protein n=1 Tax=Pediococcus acidilactici TaxID=1254 RepID=UPI001328829D|nr:ATP-binding cassette domain-containing protein [Pediococcus acidilactici]KAF0464535.1 ATP-binding cassette domain-containing protein [Pediococcus acidilactici]KAF0471604.1 ATP-binding cassette domain-containing protein [Pediococcus acidilactici]KAF0489317.1 ATP-binding cassette domain-containing protein [Pediococcus acidilactici]KAF0525212.1 ATP-binding cassette domain-containing protein [Pediococcus acidilactici]KAF0796540.1 ATP-binding cassette domain-containing protein [Pediococcus acidi